MHPIRAKETAQGKLIIPFLLQETHFHAGEKASRLFDNVLPSAFRVQSGEEQTVCCCSQRGSRGNCSRGDTIGLPVGTAFFVSDEYLLTAAHVIRSAPNSGLYVPILVPNTNRIGGSDAFEYEVAEISDEYDIALLKLKGKPRRKLVPFTLAIGTLSPGTEIAITGYGSLADFPLTFTGVVASQGSMHFGTALLQAQPRPAFGQSSSIFVIDRPLPGGFSGSPVYVRGTGVVYGIAVEIRPDLNSGAPAMSLAHPLKKAQEFLEKHHVQYSVVPPENAFVNP